MKTVLKSKDGMFTIAEHKGEYFFCEFNWKRNRRIPTHKEGYSFDYIYANTKHIEWSKKPSVPVNLDFFNVVDNPPVDQSSTCRPSIIVRFVQFIAALFQ